jgi:hypothetical protein
MSEYAAKSYISLDDVRDHPIRATIVDCDMGSFEKPVLILDTGARFSLNKTNVRTLITAFGDDSRDYNGCRVEFFAGQIAYQGSLRDSVLVRPLPSDDD